MLVSEVIELAQNSDLKQLKVSEDPTVVLGYLNLGILNQIWMNVSTFLNISPERGIEAEYF